MKTSKSLLKSLVKPLLSISLAISLVLTLAFSHADSALAARSGGRIGGGSFRAPSRTYSQPSRYNRAPGGNYYPGGGGFSPFFYFPFFGLGGGTGGLFSLLIMISIAGFLVQNFRRVSEGGDSLGGGAYNAPTVSVAKVQVGLLAQARGLQTDLDRLAQKANTESTQGLAQVLQETTLAMLRHPEYWMYGATESRQARLEAAGAEFNQLALSERSKFTAETLSNVNNQHRSAAVPTSSLTITENNGALTEVPLSGEYIVVTLLVGTQGKLQLPVVNSEADLKAALSQLGSISSDQLLALEVLWTPQAEGDVLTKDDLLVEYPTLKMV